MLAVLILFPTIYMVASSIEWAIHRYIMHCIDNSKIPSKALRNINRQHVLHHNVTNTDMTIKPSLDGYKKQKLSRRQEKFQGLYFTWRINIAITFGFIVGSAVVNFVVGVILSPVIVYDVTYTVAISLGLVLCLWMNVVWNYVHPTLHHAEGLKLSEGLDLLPRRDWMQDTFIYNYLWKHHVLHHFLKGENAGNFNVTLPGADWLYGTYHTECEGYKLDVRNKKIYKLKK